MHPELENQFVRARVLDDDPATSAIREHADLSEGQGRAVAMPLVGALGAGAGLGAGYLAAKHMSPGATEAFISPGKHFLKTLGASGSLAALDAIGLHSAGGTPGQVVDRLLARGVLPAAAVTAAQAHRGIQRAGIPMGVGAALGAGLGLLGGYALGGRTGRAAHRASVEEVLRRAGEGDTAPESSLNAGTLLRAGGGGLLGALAGHRLGGGVGAAIGGALGAAGGGMWGDTNRHHRNAMMREVARLHDGS